MRSRWTCLIMSLGLIFTAGLTPTVLAADPKPTDGWTLHIEARRHFPSQPDLVAPHYCQEVSGGMIECQICDSDPPDATLVGVVVMVGPETDQTFSAAEKARWHAHKTEIPTVAAAFPDLSPEEAAQVEKKMEGTYGEVYWL
jgi:Protein of unknown function (DUF1264)